MAYNPLPSFTYNLNNRAGFIGCDFCSKNETEIVVFQKCSGFTGLVFRIIVFKFKRNMLRSVLARHSYRAGYQTIKITNRL